LVSFAQTNSGDHSGLSKQDTAAGVSFTTRLLARNALWPSLFTAIIQKIYKVVKHKRYNRWNIYCISEAKWHHTYLTDRTERNPYLVNSLTHSNIIPSGPYCMESESRSTCPLVHSAGRLGNLAVCGQCDMDEACMRTTISSLNIKPK
jgi:hypothetical protein